MSIIDLGSNALLLDLDGPAVHDDPILVGSTPQLEPAPPTEASLKQANIKTEQHFDSSRLFQPMSNSKSVVRSRSSFFLDGIVSALPLVKVDLLKSVKKKSLEEKVFKDLDSTGFSGMWNHPMTRTDVMQYKMDCKKQSAIKIYHLYLSKHALLPLRFTDNSDVKHFVAKIKANMEHSTPSSSIFDDVAYLAHINLRYLYYGDNESAAASPIFPLTREIDFKETVFYQMIQNDLRGKWKPNTDQYIKAIERLLDMPKAYFKNEDLWIKLEEFTLNLGVDLDVIKSIIELAKKGIVFRNTSPFKGKSALSLADSKPESEDMLSSGYKPKSGNFLVQGTFQNAEHTFVQYHGVNQNKFCESCLDEAGSIESSSLYKCEVCGYVCHKACRKEVHVSCTIVIGNNGEEDGHSDALKLTEKIDSLEKRCFSIQKEVDIEARILDGMLKMGQAKANIKDAKTAKNKISPQELIMQEQIEKSSKKLELFRIEKIKCQQQMDVYRLEASAIREKDTACGSSADMIQQLAKQVNDIFDLTLPLHVADASLNYTSVLFQVDMEMTANEWIGVACEALALANPQLYVITHINSDNEEIILDQSIPLREYTIDLAVSKLYLKLTTNIKISAVDVIKQTQRILEVCTELIETERGYSADIVSVVNLFYQPFLDSNLISVENLQGVFSNIESIASIHADIIGLLDKIDCTDPTSVIKCFNEHIHRLTEYYQYCGNQHTARRLLNEIKLDPIVMKDIQRQEQSPQLNKLTIADLLVKPLHRITRYPLLFKRLLSHLTADTEAHTILSALLAGVEEKIGEVNEIVRLNESTHRIKLIDENMDFGNIELCNGRRELLSEKNMTYYRKGMREPADVTLLLFNDLLVIAKMRKPDHFMMFRAPIPLEEAVFLDKADTPTAKHIFQIIHLQQEIHTLQTRSKTDKAVWLVLAEDQRLLFCLSYIEFEGSILKDKADQSQLECVLDEEDTASISDSLLRTSTFIRKEEPGLGLSQNASNGLALFKRSNSIQVKNDVIRRLTLRKKEDARVGQSDDEIESQPMSNSNELLGTAAHDDSSLDSDTRSLTSSIGQHSRAGTGSSMKDRMKRSLVNAGSGGGLTTWLRKKKTDEPRSRETSQLPKERSNLGSQEALKDL